MPLPGIIASSIGFQKGLRKFDNLADKTIAIDALGSTAHYQLLEIARAKVLFAELHVVDAGGGGFGDFAEQGEALIGLGTRKGSAVGDVAEEHCASDCKRESQRGI